MRRYQPSGINRLLDTVLPLPEGDWDAGWRTRLPASIVLGLARGLLRLPGPRVRGAGTAVLALFHLGDQLRMLNVLSRFAGPPPAIFTNAEALPPLELYENPGPVTVLPYHGLTALASRAPHPFEHFLLPHPSMTLPSALVYARRSAARVAAVTTGEYAYAARGIEFIAADRTSWRTFYQSFFEAELGSPAADSRPRLLPRYRRAPDTASRRIVCHLSAGMAERSMPPETARGVLAALRAGGLEPVLIGAERERALLTALAGEDAATVLVGRPLPEIAGELARARAFVGLESSMAHLADAVGTPAVVIYSATTPEIQGPFYTAFRAVRVAEPTITTVSGLTGRLPKPRCEWGELGPRVAQAVIELLEAPECSLR